MTIKNGSARAKRALASGLLSAVMAGAMLGGMSTSAQAAECVTPSEQMAMKTRVVQTELMVAALSCGEAPRYNSFVKTYRDQLMDSHGQIKGYFTRTKGRGGEKALNSYITQLANQSSIRNSKGADEFCERTAKMYDKILSRRAPKLEKFVNDQRVASEYGFEACSRSAAVSTDSKAEEGEDSGLLSGLFD